MQEDPSYQHIVLLRRALMVYAVIFILWGLYRLLFRFPVFIEELVFKPIIFLLPVFSVLAGEGKSWRSFAKSFGLNKQGISLSIYYGLTLGVVYIMAVRLGGYVFSQQPTDHQFSISTAGFMNLVLLSLVTASWEQLVFSGFLLLRFMRALNDEWASASLSALLFTLLHLPILVFETPAPFVLTAIQLLLFFLVGFGNAVLMLRTRNILAPILSHTFWAMAVGLFA